MYVQRMIEAETKHMLVAGMNNIFVLNGHAKPLGMPTGIPPPPGTKLLSREAELKIGQEPLRCPLTLHLLTRVNKPWNGKKAIPGGSAGICQGQIKG